MHQNKINQCEGIANEMRRGWPFGTAEAFKIIPALFARIHELEAVLAPLAQVAKVNWSVPPDNGMQIVRWEDLVQALAMMDPQNSQVLINRESFFDVPAE